MWVIINSRKIHHKATCISDISHEVFNAFFVNMSKEVRKNLPDINAKPGSKKQKYVICRQSLFIPPAPEVGYIIQTLSNISAYDIDDLNSTTINLIKDAILLSTEVMCIELVVFLLKPTVRKLNQFIKIK